MKRWIILPLVGLFVLSARAQELPRFITDSLDSYCRNGIRDWQIPGMALAIVKDGKVVFMKGYGVREYGKSDPVDDNTLFMIGSNTKLFTATILAMLEEEKKLSLNDKVTKWLPSFKLHNPLAGEQATVRDLLCHRLGFETFQGDFTYWRSTLSRKDVVEKMGLVNPVYGFRAKWGYTNAAFVAAGEVIQAVTGQPWETYLQKTIIQPLGMNRTRLLSAELAATANAAAPHTLVDGDLVKLSIPLIDNLAPAGSISSSVNDMTHWLITQLNSGEYEGKRVIPARAIQSTRSAQSILGTDSRPGQESHFYLYGLGLELTDRAGKLVVSHTGGVDGFLSSVVLVPDEGLGIIVVTNSDQNNFFLNLTDEIRDSFLHLPYSSYSRQSLERTRTDRAVERHWLDSLHAVVARKNKPELELKNYAGDFSDPLYGNASVMLEGTRLTLHFSHHPTLTGNLEFLQGSSFLCTFSIPTFGIKEIPFHVSNGKATGFTLHVADFVEFTPYEFVRK